jgi:hypothetical protein
MPFRKTNQNFRCLKCCLIDVEILSMQNFEHLIAEDNLKMIKEKSAGMSKKLQQKYMVKCSVCSDTLFGPALYN